VTASRSFYEFFKANPNQTKGQLFYDLGNRQWNIPKLRELLETILPQKTTFDNYKVEHDFADIGKRVMLLNARQIQKASGKERIILLAIEDITERKLVESQKETALDALRKSEDNFHRSLDDSPLGVRIVTADGETLYANQAIVDIYGCDSIEELKGAPLKDLYTPESYAEFKIRKGKRERGEFCPPEYEISIVRKNGEVRHVYAFRKEIFWNGARQFQVIYQDITDRKRAEETLKKSESKYRLLADNIHDVIFVMDMNLTYSYLSPSVKLLRGYEPEEAMKQTPAETVTPSSLNLAMGILSEIMELEKSEHRDINVSRTFQVEMIRKDGTTVWTEVNAFLIRDENQRATGIMGVTRDITDRRRSEEELQKTLGRLRKSIDTTIGVLVSAVESRDPYTAGHQLRVADLARAIATEMGLPQDKIDGIRMAGSIHDIGKLSIPVEILSKPTRLTDVEFTLIKGHSKIGYEMLKDVESPWPLAQIVYQHHERMNGTGYPRNLKGDEILIEARIMTVADVVEAIASHRPYRAALGIEIALEEIEKNKGIFYDTTVADACLRLFREKGYQFT
ncbi:MAG: PAS domain S-box protein, partial [Smithella sp.]